MSSDHTAANEEKLDEVRNNESLLSPSCRPPQADMTKDHGSASSPEAPLSRPPPREKSESNERNPDEESWESAKFRDIVGQNLDETIPKNPNQKSARMLIVLGWHMFWTILFFCAYFFRSGKFEHDPHFLSRTIAFACISAGVFAGIVVVFLFNKLVYQMATQMILGQEIIEDYTIVYIELWIMGPLRILGIWAPREMHHQGENETQSPAKTTEDAQSSDSRKLYNKPADEEEDSNKGTLSPSSNHQGEGVELADARADQGLKNPASSGSLRLSVVLGDRGSPSMPGASLASEETRSNDCPQKTTVAWTVCDWIQLALRWLHVAICTTPFLVLIACDLKNIHDNLPHGKYARHVGYLFHEIYELVLYGAAVLAFWNAGFVEELFLLDNAASVAEDEDQHDESIFASVPEDKDQHDARKKARSFLRWVFLGCPPNQSENEVATEPRDIPQDVRLLEDKNEAPPVGEDGVKKGAENSEDKKPKRRMSKDVVYNSWGFTWWFMTPAALFALVAYCASVTLDTVPYRSYDKYNDWLPYFFNLTPLGGTSYFVGNGFVSGTSFIISVAVWFCCRTVTLELNRIAREFNDTHEVQIMLHCVNNVQERMTKIFNELKYIILVQTAFAIIMIGLLAIQILGRIPNVHIVIVDEDSFVSAFVSLCQSVVTIAFASQIFEQWNCIYHILMDYERQRLANDAYNGDLMHVVHYVERAPIGVKMFGVFIGEQFLNNIIMLVVGEAFAIACQIATDSLAK